LGNLENASSLGNVFQEYDIMYVNLFFDGVNAGLLTLKTGSHQ